MGMARFRGRDVVIWCVPHGISFRDFLKEEPETADVVILLTSVVEAVVTLRSLCVSIVSLTARYEKPRILPNRQVTS
jgi:hypothetical protein